MFTQKISTSFTRYSDANFEQKAQHILDSMKKNAAFATPTPTLTVYEDAVNRYSTALVAAATLDRTAVAEKNEARRQLETLSTQLGTYVMNVSNGNAKMLTSSGFTLTKKPEPRHLPAMGPVKLNNNGNSGQMLAAVKALPGATGYVYKITTNQPTEASQWTSVATSTSKYTFTDLTPGRQYRVMVVATGARQQELHSPVASQYAQ